MVAKDVVMIDAMAMWHSEHKRFAQLLDFLEWQMEAFHAGRQPHYALMREVVHYLHHYGDVSHHPREDVAFARLAALSPEAGMTISRLLQEHRVIAVAGNVLLDYLNDILNDAIVEREAVEAAAATYLVYYRHHIACEEKEIFPRAAQLLTAADWAAVANAVATIPDPLFGNHVDARYRALREEIGQVA